MNTIDIDSITDKICRTILSEDVILSYKGQSLKLNDSQDGKKIADAIKEKKGLITLNLEGNTLGIEAAQQIGDALKLHPTFKNALWSDLFTGRMKSEIPIALVSIGKSLLSSVKKHLSSGIMTAAAQLTVLDLSDNAFGPNGMKGIVDLLGSSSCYRLQVLKLNNNGLGTTGGKMLAKSLTKCFEESVKVNQRLALKVFVSGRGRLEDEGSIALSKAFKMMGSLEELSMPQNGITHVGISALSEALSYNLKLRSINLSDNTFTETGARSMAKTLRKLKNLVTIDFSDCLLRNGGAELLAQSFSVNRHRHLETVNMSFNEILLAGAEQLLSSLMDKPSLKTIHLDGNMLGDDGIGSICDTAESAGKSNLLGEFNEDEGLDSDEDEELSDTEYILTEGDDSDGADETEKNNEIIEDFLKAPKSTKLKELSLNNGMLITEFVEISNSLTLNKIEVSEDVSCCLDALFKSLANQNRDQAAGVLANNILSRIGIIKNEDRRLTPVDDITTSLYLLCNTVKKSYFEDSVAEIICNYLERFGQIII